MFNLMDAHISLINFDGCSHRLTCPKIVGCSHAHLPNFDGCSHLSNFDGWS